MSTHHTVTIYEILSMMPAPPGVEAVFQEDGGGLLYDPVFAFAVAKVSEQDYDEKGRKQSEPRPKPNEVVGLLMAEEADEPIYGHDMICEQVSGFRGYRRRKLT